MNQGKITGTPVQKDKTAEIMAAARDKRKRALIFAVLAVFLLTVAFAGINILFLQLDNKFNLAVDLTSNLVYELSDETGQVLDNLAEPVNVYTFFRASQNNRVDVKLLNKVSRVIEKFAAYSPQIKVENIDPQLNPTFAQQFDTAGSGIPENAVIVSNSDRSRFKVLLPSELFIWDESNNPIGIAVEQKMTSAVYYLMTGIISRVRVLQGHYEPQLSELAPLVRAFQLSNAEVSAFSFVEDQAPLNTQNDILLIVGPKRDLTDAETEYLTGFINQGGKILAMFDPLFNDKLSNFRKLLQLFRVDLGDNVIYESDPDRYYKQPLNIVPNLEPIPLLIQPLIDAGLAPVFPVCRSIIMPQTAEDTTAAVALLTTSENAFAKTSEGADGQTRLPDDPVGPFVIGTAAYIDKGEGTDADAKLILFGTSQFASDETLMQIQGNFSLIINSVGWLTSSREVLAIPAKFIGSYAFVIPNEASMILVIILLGALPLLILAIGISVHIKRRHQ